MAHFAELDENDIVIRIIVVDNKDILDLDGKENEGVGIAYCHNLLGGKWIQTSYNGNFRKNYAGTGYYFDITRNAFIPPKPFSKWILNEETCRWEAPFSQPDEVQPWYWDDELGQWIS
jgi:hypothetical protein